MEAVNHSLWEAGSLYRRDTQLLYLVVRTQILSLDLCQDIQICMFQRGSLYSEAAKAKVLASVSVCLRKDPRDTRKYRQEVPNLPFYDNRLSRLDTRSNPADYYLRQDRLPAHQDLAPNTPAPDWSPQPCPNPHPHEARTHLHTPSFRWAAAPDHSASALPTTHSPDRSLTLRHTSARWVHPDTPPACSSLLCPSPDCTPASGYPHNRYDTGSDILADSYTTCNHFVNGLA